VTGSTESRSKVATSECAKLVLHAVQNFANVLWRIFAMIQKTYEIRDRALEVHVVLPERVIRVDEQRLRAIGLG
jgi:hypothetical protein